MDFTADELSEMRSAQTDHMMDTCVIQSATETVDGFGEYVRTYADGSAIDCGLDMRSGSERDGADNIILEWDATLRLAITVSVTEKDRIKVTKRFGETLGSALVYEVVSPIQRGPSGIRVLLRRLQV